MLRATFGLDRSVIGVHIPIHKGLVGRVARTKKVVAVKEPETHEDYFPVPGSGEEKYRTFLGVPLFHNGALRGVLVVQTCHSHLYLLDEIALIFEAGRKIEADLAA